MLNLNTAVLLFDVAGIIGCASGLLTPKSIMETITEEVSENTTGKEHIE